MASDRDAALDRFVTAWSGLASLFGFNPSTARVSALLIGAATPLSLSEIAARLGISRGNASMCLKELRAWGVVQKVAQPADRQDWYVRRGGLVPPADRERAAAQAARVRSGRRRRARRARRPVGGREPGAGDADPRDRGVPDRARPRRPRGARRREGRTSAGRHAAAQLRPPEGGVMAP